MMHFQHNLTLFLPYYFLSLTISYLFTSFSCTLISIFNTHCWIHFILNVFKKSLEITCSNKLILKRQLVRKKCNNTVLKIITLCINTIWKISPIFKLSLSCEILYFGPNTLDQSNRLILKYILTSITQFMN